MKYLLLITLLFSATTLGQVEIKERTGVGNIQMVYVPAGSFLMGSPTNEPWRDKDEGPQRQVTLSKGFWMGKFEVTQEQYLKVMGTNPSYHKECDRCPVETVSWDQANEFLKKLSTLDQELNYRLPTEAEWEYAARAGSTTPLSFGSKVSPENANYDLRYPYEGGSKGQYKFKPVAVGSYQPNAFGLYDMHGNVWEWVEDIYVRNAGYSGLPTDGSANLKGDDGKRVRRGGGWNSWGKALRSANRGWKNRRDPNRNGGFRVVAERK